MKDNAQAPVYILSVSQADLSKDENADADTVARRYLDDEGISYKVVQGSYKGSKETSYVVNAANADTVHFLAAKYNQDSVLFLDGARNAFLRYLADWHKEVYVGQFQTASEAVAVLQDGYTHDTVKDIYYIINK